MERCRLAVHQPARDADEIVATLELHLRAGKTIGAERRRMDEGQVRCIEQVLDQSAQTLGLIYDCGEQFLLGDGTPVRFWGINTGHDLLDADDATIQLTARRWAKYGINLVRIHGAMFDRSGKDPYRVDPRKIQRLYHVVHALKQEGIYSHLSFGAHL